MTNATLSVQPAARDIRSPLQDTGPVRSGSTILQVIKSQRISAKHANDGQLKLPSEEPIFRDTAHTVLPMEYHGRNIMMEAHAYEDDSASYQAMALVYRKPGSETKAPFVRVHSGCVTGDIFHSLRCDCYPQLQASMDVITKSPLGVMIYLPYQEGRGIGLVNQFAAQMNLQSHFASP